MKKQLKKLVRSIAENFRSKNDPSGGYTGNTVYGGKPSQDADDL